MGSVDFCVRELEKASRNNSRRGQKLENSMGEVGAIEMEAWR